MRLLALALLPATAALMLGCAHRNDAALYEQLGGEAGVEQIVDGLIRGIAGDPRLKPHFRNIHIAGFRERLGVFLCETSDGPCQWDGRSMRESHRHLDIDASAFNALVEALIDSMDEARIPLGAQNALLARLAPMRDDILVR